MLEVRNLHASIGDKEILRGINLTVKDGETHAIMGPNGSGKSTLSAVLVGNPLYEVTEGEAWFNGKNLLEMKPEDRAHEGMFLSFQYPVEIPGVSMTNFMKAAINAKREYEGKEPLKAADFLKMMREKRKVVELDSKLSNRSVNEGFSGGEKKRNEIFQMAMLEPKLAILDETDSGLDVDAMRIVAEGVNKLMTPQKSCIVITHYDRLLEMIRPQYVHVLYKGRIVKTAGPELAKQIQEHGYDWLKDSPLTPPCKTASPDRYGLLKGYARENRKNATLAEDVLWNYLRRGVSGVKFLRQHVIGDYIVDFVSRHEGLVVEVDGGYHSEPRQQESDELREEELERMGYHVIRFSNEEVMNDIESVLDEIREGLSPGPSL